METFLVIVECAIQHNDKFLIIRRPEGVHAGGLLAFPGGKVDYQDGLSQNTEDHSDNNEEQVAQDILLKAAKREVKEEVGLDLIDPLSFVRSTYFIDKNGQNVLGALYHCNIQRTPLTLNVSLREVPEHFWMSCAEINAHDKTPVWLRHDVGVLEKNIRKNTNG